MAPPGRLRLTEIRPGLYRTWWSVPPDVDPGRYILRGTLNQRGETRAVRPLGELVITPQARGTVFEPFLPPPPTAPPPAAGPPPSAGGPTPPGGGLTPLGAGNPLSTYVHQGLRPDLPLWVTPDDKLVLIAKSIIVGNISLSGAYKLWTASTPEGLDPDQPFPLWSPISAQMPELFASGVLNASVPGDGFTHTFIQPLSYGYLVSAAINGQPLGAARGLVYASLWLARGTASNLTFYRCLAADYVEDMVGPSFPEGPILGAENSRGHITNYDGSVPLAGQETMVIQPTGARWRLIHVGARLTTSAVVGNRTPSLSIGSFGFGSQIIGTQVVAASTQIEIGWWTGLADSGHTGTQINLWLPSDVSLEGGQVVQTKTAGLLAGDQWSDMTVLVEEVLTSL